MQHAKIKSGFTTEGSEFTEGGFRSIAVLAVGAPLEGRTKPRIKDPSFGKLNLPPGIDFTQGGVKRWSGTFLHTRNEDFIFLGQEPSEVRPSPPA